MPSKCNCLCIPQPPKETVSYWWNLDPKSFGLPWWSWWLLTTVSREKFPYRKLQRRPRALAVPRGGILWQTATVYMTQTYNTSLWVCLGGPVEKPMTDSSAGGTLPSVSFSQWGKGIMHVLQSPWTCVSPSSFLTGNDEMTLVGPSDSWGEQIFSYLEMREWMAALISQERGTPGKGHLWREARWAPCFRLTQKWFGSWGSRVA